MNKRLMVDWTRYVDDSGRECERCSDTRRELDRAVELFKKEISPSIDIDIRVHALDRDERDASPLRVNSVKVADQTLEHWIDATVALSACCDVCRGAQTRAYTIDDQTWSVLPAEEIVKGLVRAAVEKGWLSCGPQDASSLNTVPCDCAALGNGIDCSDTSPKASGRNWLKTAAASVVLVAAVAAAGYSIIRSNSDPSDLSGQTEVSSADSTATITCAPSLFSLGGDSTISPVAVAVLTGVVSDVDVAFVLLSGADNDATQNASAAVESIVKNLSAQGKSVKVVSFAPGSPGYVGLVSLGKIISFPSVAALGHKGGYAFLSSGEISEVKLLRSFVVAVTPIPTCAPGSPGCTPAGGK